jgi:hypothetical protein
MFSKMREIIHTNKLDLLQVYSRKQFAQMKCVKVDCFKTKMIVFAINGPNNIFDYLSTILLLFTPNFFSGYTALVFYTLF